MKMSNIAKGAAVGMAVGATAIMITQAKSNRARMMRKKAGKAMKAVGTMIDDISYMMK